MDLIYLLRVLYRKIWILLVIPLIAGVAAFFFAQNIQKKYKSTAQLSAGFTTNNRVEISKENFDYWESKANFENLIETMRSGVICSMVSYNLLYHDLTEPTPFRELGPMPEHDLIRVRLKENIDSFRVLSAYDKFENKIIKTLDKQRYDYIKWIKDGDLVVERIKDTDFIKVEFLSENPFLSAFVVNQLCQEYIRYNNVLKSTLTVESLQFFESQMLKKKEELDAKTKELNDYKSSNQVYNYDRESDSKLGQLSEYEIQLQKEENKANGLALAIRNVETRIAHFNKNTVTANNSRLLELRNKINKLNQIYIDDGSKDKDLQKTILDLQEQLKTEMTMFDVETDRSNKKSKTMEELVAEKEGYELDYQIAQSNVASIQSKVYGLKSNVSRIGSKESTLASLDRERDNAFKDYTSASEKYNEAKSKSLITATGVKVMIKGQPSAKPESSKTLIIIALAIFGCGALCVGTIIMTEFFDYRLKTPERFVSFSKLNLIGHVNKIDSRKLDLSYMFRQKQGREEVEMIKHFLRKIRFVVVNSGKRVLLVSSTRVGEGKTFLIMALAHSLSLLNKRILIIDTNFKHNSLTKLMVARPMLQRANEQKFLNSGPVQASVESEHSQSMISHTVDKNVDIIGCSEGYESPSEIFAGRDFRAMIEALKQKYDYIFMEGASLNDYSDTKELIQFSEGVIAIFSAESSLQQADRDSLKYLKNLNGKFIGAILNRVNNEDIKV